MEEIDLNKMPFDRLTIQERIEVLLSKVENGLEKYNKDSTFNACVKALAYGQEPIFLIDQICTTQMNMVKQMEKMIEVMPAGQNSLMQP